MRVLSLAAPIALFIAVLLVGCDEERCPNRVTRTVVRCDEETRTCTEVTEDSCPCDPATDPWMCQSQGRRCEAVSGIDGIVEPQDPRPFAPVVDGAFTGEEWTGVVPLQGLYTDAYVTYHDGRLYFLNDWRVNDEGARGDCFNFFQIRVGTDFLDLKVYGDGSVVLQRNGEDVPDVAEGAYGFGASPNEPRPHTIFEFSVPVQPLPIDVCCSDPVTLSQCDKLAQEPMVISLRFQGEDVAVGKSFPGGYGGVPQAAGERCEPGVARCADGLVCHREDPGAPALCVGVMSTRDGGVPDADIP